MYKITPDEVIKNLDAIGVKITRPTLSRYEKQRFIPKPKRGALGRGGGRWTDYPESAVVEAYAAHSMLHGNYGDDIIRELFGGKMPLLPPDVISIIRDMHDHKCKNALPAGGLVEKSIYEPVERSVGESIAIKGDNYKLIESLWELWFKEVCKARSKMSD